MQDIDSRTSQSARSGAQLDVDTMLDRARQVAGLSDFGDLWFLEPLAKLIEFINAEAGLISDREPPVMRIQSVLATRLRMIEHLKLQPEIHDEKIEVPGIIIGLPRGGSTMLQRMIASAPQMTAPYWWEMNTPLPVPGEKRGNPAERQAIGAAAIDTMSETWPDMMSMHPLDPSSHDEEVMVMDNSFLSVLWPSYFHIQSYSFWFQDQDHSKAYEELKVWLQILQYQLPWRRGRKWMLKSPQHLLACNLPVMMKVFPEAKVIMTHREIEKVITSYCSVQSLMIRDYSTTHDPKTMGRWSIEVFSRAIRRLIELRKSAPADRFIDVQYRETMADPMGAFHRVMTGMGLTVNAKDEAAARQWLEDNRRDNHPPHHYDPMDYGVTAQELADAFDFYHEEFL